MCGSSSTSPNSRTCSLEKESSTSFCGRTPRSNACAMVTGCSQPSVQRVISNVDRAAAAGMKALTVTREVL